jgi:ElaB/YqjD/DUF883 family membrane-anchored ribosome-binding protein
MEKNNNKNETDTFEKVLEMFKETDKRIEKMFAESGARFEKEMKESRAEFDKQLKESSAKSEKEWAEIRKIQAETSVQMEKGFAEIHKILSETGILLKEVGERVDNLSYNVDGIGKSNGKVAEDTIYNVLHRYKTFAGIKFDNVSRNIKGSDVITGYSNEFDVVMLNGDTIAIIEVKYKVKKNNVNKLAKTKLNDFKKFFKEYNNYKIILGIGGMGFDLKVIDTAKAKGVGIIKVIGDKVELYTEGIKIY